MKESAARKIRDGIISFVISVVGAGTLVGNAYIVENIGYPNGFNNIGIVVMLGSLVFAVLPAIPLFILSLLGSEIPFYVRDSFVRWENIGLGIYCVVFYSILIYFLLQYRRKRKEKGILKAIKSGEKS